MRMRAAENARLADGRMTVENGFDFLGKNFASGKIDHGGFSADQEQKSFPVHTADVARAEPPVLHHFFARTPWRCIGIEKPRPRNGDIAASSFVRGKNPHMIPPQGPP